MAAKSFAESMAAGMGGGDEGGDEGPDYKGSLEAAVKDFFEAGKGGDYSAAADALKTACDLCDADDGDEPSSGGKDGHTALLLVPHGGK